ncbi:MAG TPA: iron-containing redox enzyme family protein [Acidimicrobiales bacterium]|jgi:pyrroloquinoline quinone (PQQ) biosynthesis protein C|nr:iron-containing redox enzyme family protein [Acidimicrobiales bacterium]
MAFDGEAFVQELRAELEASGRGLDKAVWVERVVQGDATPQELVGWARQHYWGVTYHTRRFLSAWVVRMPYEMTDSVIENLGEEVLGTMSKSGHSHLHWLFEFTRALGAPDEVITQATPNVDAVASESFLYNMALHRPWYEFTFGGVLAIENQIPGAYTRVVEGFKAHYGDVLSPDDYRFHTIHIYVDEEHGGHVGEFAEQYLDTDEKRRSARAAYLAGAEITRRCWDALDGATW